VRPPGRSLAAGTAGAREGAQGMGSAPGGRAFPGPQVRRVVSLARRARADAWPGAAGRAACGWGAQFLAELGRTSALWSSVPPGRAGRWSGC